MLFLAILYWCYHLAMATLGLLATAVSSILLNSQGSQAGGLADIDHVVLFMQGMWLNGLTADQMYRS